MEDQTSRALHGGAGIVQFPEQEQLKCPRCDSTNTKFCYYNNYNLSQPRHFCKSCRRYWTKGGSLRNIPVGGGTRKSSSKRTSSSSSSSSKRGNRPQSPLLPTNSTSTSTTAAATTTTTVMNRGSGSGQDPTRVCGLDRLSFSSLLAGGQFGGGVSEGLNSGSFSGSGRDDPNLKVEEGGGGGGGGDGGQEGYLESEEWGNSNGWPDLAIFTPGSGFH